MKILTVIKTFMVMVVMITSVSFLPALWGVLQDAHRLGEVVREWEAAGPHTTLTGKVRERLAAARWLGPLRLLVSLRDPLGECGIPTGGRWKDVLPVMVDVTARLACLQRHVQLAKREHLIFTAMLLLAVCCLALGAALLVCSWGRQKLARRHQIRQKTVTGLPVEAPAPPVTGVAADATLEPNREIETIAIECAPKHVRGEAPCVKEGRDALPQQEAVTGNRHAPEACNSSSSVKEEGAEVLYQQEALPARENPPEACDSSSSVQKEGATDTRNTPAEDEEANCPFRHSLFVGNRLAQRLAGPSEFFLEYLQRRYCVTIRRNQAAKRLHIMGVKKDVIECYNAIAALLAEWRRRDAAKEGAEVLPQQEVMPAHNNHQKACGSSSRVQEGGAEVLPQQEDAAPVSSECLQVANTRRDATEDKEANRRVRYSLKVKSRLVQRLAGPNDFFLEYLQRRYCVKIRRSPAASELLIKGAKNDVLECYNAVKALLAEWRRREDTMEGAEVLPQQEIILAPNNTPDPYDSSPSVQEEGAEVLPQQKDASPVSAECLQAADIRGDSTEDEEANRPVSYSLLVENRLAQRLAGPSEFFLEYLQRCHCVMICRNPAAKRLYIKGVKKDVIECYNSVTALLEEWRRRDAAAE